MLRTCARTDVRATVLAESPGVMAVSRNDLWAVQVEVLEDELDKLYCQRAIFKHAWLSAVIGRAELPRRGSGAEHPTGVCRHL